MHNHKRKEKNFKKNISISLAFELSFSCMENEGGGRISGYWTKSKKGLGPTAL